MGQSLFIMFSYTPGLVKGQTERRRAEGGGGGKNHAPARDVDPDYLPICNTSLAAPIEEKKERGMGEKERERGEGENVDY